MRNAFVKDSLRQVRVTINRFLAILAVTALGVAFFAGLKATAPDMRATTGSYLNKLNFMDIDLVSTAGFTAADVNAIKAVKGVSEAMPAYSADAMVSLPQSSLTVKLLSVGLGGSSTQIDRPQLTEGRMPKNDGEVLADPRFLTLSHHKLGDKITIRSGSSSDISSILKRDSFTIVGVAQDPLYISYERGASTVGNGRVDAYLILPSPVFNVGVYTDVYLTVDNSAGLSRFDSGYDKLITPVTKALQNISGQREDIRFNELKADGQKQIDDAKAKLASGEQALADAKKQLADAQASIDKGQAEYKSNLGDYKTGLSKYNAAASQLAAGEQQAGTAGLTDAQVNAEIAGLEQMQAQYPPQLPQYQAYQAQIAGLSGVLQGRAQLAAQGAALTQAKAQLGAASATLAASQAQLDAGRQAYLSQAAQAQPGLDSANQAIADGEKKLAALAKPVWYVLDHNTNAGFVGFKQDADRIGALANVFPLIFFIVAALVSLTTMTRLVEDDRGYIGTMKALGYGRGTIAAKYLAYALAASLLGSVIGLIIGFNLFPRVVSGAYDILYTVPKVTAQFNIPYAIASTTAAVLCAALPALLVCMSSLRSRPAELMRPKVPQPGKRILLERFTLLWKRFNFSQKVTARNLFRYKKRLIMTIVGVAGCTALVFTGFGLRDSISTIVGKQYDEIRTYDMEIDTRQNASAGDMKTLNDYLGGKITGSVKINQQSVDVLVGSSVKSVYLVVPQDDNALAGYVNLRERVSKKPLKLGGDTVIISEKLATTYHLKKGDSLTIRNSDGVKKSVKIGGITENYIFHYVYMPPTLYARLYGKPPVPNQLLCKLPVKTSAYENTVSKGLMKIGAVSSVAFTTNLRSNFQKMIGALRYVVLVLILSAAALAFVVLFSLTSINIDERNRELATIKVLGFFNGELASYIYRENIVLTVISSIIGLGLGIIMERYVILTAEVDLVMFSRDILWTTYVYSAGLTLAFAAFVNLIMLRRFKKIDMVSSLKSVE